MAYRSQVVLRGVVESLDEVGSRQSSASVSRSKRMNTVKPSYGMDSWSSPRSDGLLTYIKASLTGSPRDVLCLEELLRFCDQCRALLVRLVETYIDDSRDVGRHLRGIISKLN